MCENLMSADIALRVHHLGKCYPIYAHPRDRLKQALWRGRKQFYREFWALRDISFTVKKGEALGIIGRNGSGKSTLLQLICQTLMPTTGEIEINGRVAALLELGAGFNPEFTGRENVYMNGAIIGLTREAIDERFEKIAAFADIGDFMEQPVRTYSSGMFVRLAFAVQACVDPDILIVDEALSVGDIFFQQKCAKYMKELREKGTTLIFVSHDMSLVRDLCESAVYLKQGQMLFHGESFSAIKDYFREDAQLQLQTQPLEQEIIQKNATKYLSKEFIKNAYWINPQKESLPEQNAKILAVDVVNAQGDPSMQVTMGEPLIFRVLYQVFTTNPVHLTVALKNRHDQLVNSSGSYTKGIAPLDLHVGECAIFELRINCMLEAGYYTFLASLGCVTAPNRGVVFHETPWLGPLKVDWDYENKQAPWLGMFGIPCTAKFFTLNQ